MTDNTTFSTENSTFILKQLQWVPVGFVIWDVLDKVLVGMSNSITLTIICRHWHEMLDISSNVFIGCLTLGDMVSVCIIPFNVASVYLSHGLVWDVNCFASLWLSLGSSLVNTLILCAISIDRLIYIVYPLQYHLKVPVSRAWKISIAVFVFSFVYALVSVAIGYVDASGKGSIARPCSPSFSIKGISRQLLFYPFLVFVPVTIGCYVKLGLVAYRQRRSIGPSASPPPPYPPQPPSASSHDFKITKVMLNVISVYILCTVVVMLTPLMHKYLSDPKTREISFRISIFIWRANMWLNPLIYSWKSKNFRRYLNMIFNKNSVMNLEARQLF